MNRCATVIAILLVSVVVGRADALDVGTDNPARLILDHEGDFIIAAGSPPSVIKIQANSGPELWRYEMDAATGVPKILVAPDGNDIVVGGVIDGKPVVVRLDKATGAEMWRSTPPADIQGGAVLALAVDSAAHIYAAMWLDRGHNNVFIDMDVFHLARTTGEELWHQQLDGIGSEPVSADYGASIAVDISNNLIVAGTIFDADSQRVFVAKVLYFDGAIAWFRRIVGDGAALPNERFTVSRNALDLGGDESLADDPIAVVAVTHNGGNGPQFRDFTVAVLDPDTGNDVWRHDIDGRGHGTDDAFEVGFDWAGDVTATGRLKLNRRHSRMVTMKFSADGTLLWKRRFPNFVYYTSEVREIGQSFACGQRVTASGKSYSVLQKLRSNGIIAWRRQTRNGACRDIVPLTDGEVLAVGVFDDIGSLLRFTSTRGLIAEP